MVYDVSFVIYYPDQSAADVAALAVTSAYESGNVVAPLACANRCLSGMVNFADLESAHALTSDLESASVRGSSSRGHWQCHECYHADGLPCKRLDFERWHNET